MKPFKPHDLAFMTVPTSTRRRVVEVLSFPVPGGTIMVRMVPGDCETLREVPLSLLAPCNKTRYIHFAEVEGRFMFPEDMLRYDGAALCDPDQPEDEYRPTGPVLIYKISDRARPPWTDARWLSFGCKVRHILTHDFRKSPTGIGQ